MIHPSVYLILFDHMSTLIPLNPRESELQKRLSDVEMRMLGTIDNMIIDHGFWTGVTRRDVSDDRWPVRVLICGNAGVGKSTLINRVFGVPVVSVPPSLAF